MQKEKKSKRLTPERGPLGSASAQSDGIRAYQRAIAFPSLRLRARAARPEPSQSRSQYNGGCVRKRPGDSAVTPPIRVNSEPGSAIALAGFSRPQKGPFSRFGGVRFAATGFLGALFLAVVASAFF